MSRRAGWRAGWRRWPGSALRTWKFTATMRTPRFLGTRRVTARDGGCVGGRCYSGSGPSIEPYCQRTMLTHPLVPRRRTCLEMAAPRVRGLRRTEWESSAPRGLWVFCGIWHVARNPDGGLDILARDYVELNQVRKRYQRSQAHSIEERSLSLIMNQVESSQARTAPLKEVRTYCEGLWFQVGRKSRCRRDLRHGLTKGVEPPVARLTCRWGQFPKRKSSLFRAAAGNRRGA